VEEKPFEWEEKPLSPEQLEVQKMREQLFKLPKMRIPYEAPEEDPDFTRMQVALRFTHCCCFHSSTFSGCNQADQGRK